MRHQPEDAAQGGSQQGHVLQVETEQLSESDDQGRENGQHKPDDQASAHVHLTGNAPGVHWRVRGYRRVWGTPAEKITSVTRLAGREP
ncbi:hypothetical protein GCM10027517_27040 [Phycicoccus ginsengisoli]